MPDPMPSLYNVLNINRNLPNGGGKFNVANSTPSGIVNSVPQAPAQSPDFLSYLNSLGKTTPAVDTSTTPSAPTSTPQTSTTPTSGSTDLESIINQYKKPDNTPTQNWGIGGTAPTTSNAPLDFMSLRGEQLRDRANGTGLYAIPANVSLTPDQVFGLRSMADKHYEDLMQSATDYSKQQIEAKKAAAENAPATDYSSDPWMQGLVVNGLVQGGTAGERKAHEAMLSKLAPEQKQQLIKSSLYNSMSTGERATFDTGDNLAAGVKQIFSDMDNDFRTNPAINLKQTYGGYLGGKQDPKYLAYQAMVGNLSAPIINQIYGAAVTGSELARAKKFIPDTKTDTTAMALTKLQQLAGFYDYANASKLARKAGVPMTETMDDYIAKYDPNYHPIGGGTKSSSDSVGWY